MELETYVQTRAGLNDLYSATQRNLDTESKRRTQLQQELDVLKSARTEKEVSWGLNYPVTLNMYIYTLPRRWRYSCWRRMFTRSRILL